MIRDEEAGALVGVMSLVRCPIGREPLRAVGDTWRCPCGVQFPVRDGLPVLVPEAGELPRGIDRCGLACRRGS